MTNVVKIVTNAKNNIAVNTAVIRLQELQLLELQQLEIRLQELRIARIGERNLNDFVLCHAGCI
jgi:hypothetical protein